MIVELFETDLAEIMDFEKVAFEAAIQANLETYRQRFRKGHVMLGLRKQGIQGVISFSYGIFDPNDPFTIPKDFGNWSTQSVPSNYNTAFIYNLGLSPTTRGTGAIQGLIFAALRRAIMDGCHQVLAEGPVPSYSGTRHVRANPDIRASLDAHAAGGAFPDEELLFRDPHLALYRRICHCKILRIMPDFLPSDVASGGFRVMLFRDLQDLTLPDEFA